MSIFEYHDPSRSGVRLSLGEGCDGDTLTTLLGRMEGYTCRLTVRWGADSSVSFDATMTAVSAHYSDDDVACCVDFLACDPDEANDLLLGDQSQEGEVTKLVIPWSVIEAIHVY